MAAYAAIVSLTHTIDQAHHLVSLDREKIESVRERVNFLREFLEGSNINGEEGLESRIADAAYAAEDAIESNFVDQILAGSTSQNDKANQGLQKVIEDMDFIKKDVTEMKEKYGIKDLQPRNAMPAGSSRVLPNNGKNKMVGFDDELIEILENLTGSQPARRIVPIVGMGGIGKTMLARTTYDHSLIVQYFDIRAWVTISQEYNLREILVGILFAQRKQGTKENFVDFCNQMSETSEEDLGIQLYKSLSGRRYMIVLDDMWSMEVWDKIKMFFPDNNNGSRIVVTTRLSNLANYLSSSNLELKFLDLDNSWDLLCEKVFAQDCCPLELEEIGKKIAKNCKGLPLSIVVTAGLLANSEKTLEYWKHVAEDVSSIANSDDHEHCLKVLSLSYNQLPVHLKPCFLYIAVFPEDHEIRVSELTKLWVAEGFVKPCRAKSLEESAEEFLMELIERNLILVHKWGSSGKIKSCNIHDLLRDLCLREAQREKFLCVMRMHNLDVPQGMNSLRRIVINQGTLEKKYSPQVLGALQSASLARSLICNFDQVLPSLTFRLLRVLNVIDKYSYKPKDEEDKYPLDVIFQLVNSRYLAFRTDWKSNSTFPSSICFLRNIQTLIVRGTWGTTIAPSEIWDMPQLRHIKFDVVFLPDPPSNRMDGRDFVVLENLLTLMNIENFRFSEEVLKKIPNIKKLGITYDEAYGGYEEWSHYCLDNLDRLEKLESLSCFFLKYKPKRNVLLQNFAFPFSLKKLTLHGCGLFWEDMTMIGTLPHLEVLKLKVGSFVGAEWNPVEGEFLCLKFLQIEWCKDLINWNADSTHFPRLERLVLQMLQSLNEIPLDIGEIPTLRFIQLEYCSDSAVVSARNILDEQESLGNVGLQVRVHLLQKSELESLASENFQVQTCNIL